MTKRTLIRLRSGYTVTGLVYADLSDSPLYIAVEAAEVRRTPPEENKNPQKYDIVFIPVSEVLYMACKYLPEADNNKQTKEKNL